MNGLRSHELLHRRSSRLLIVDVQDKFLGTLPPEIQRRLVDTCHEQLSDSAEK